MNNLRFAFRQLFKNWSFTAVGALTLALGIGVNVTIFSMVNAILLRPFPAADPERLATVSVYNKNYGPTERGAISLPDLLHLQEHNRSFESLFGMYSDGFVMAGNENAERIQGSVVSASFLEVLGVRPAFGRGFLAEEGEPGRAGVALISYGLWQRRFNGEKNLESIQARLNGGSVQVIGVMPPGFRFPIESDIWMPLARNPDAARGSRYIKVVGKLNPGVSIEQAGAEVRQLTESLAQQHPETNRDLSASVYELRGLLLPGPIRLLLWLLLGAVACVLLITCANVAGLILVRGWSRRKELAIRASLGAGRAKLLGLLTSESMILAILGGLIGLALSRFGLDAILTLIPEQIPYWIQFTVDWRVLSFTLGAALLAGLAAGLLPAWQVVRTDPAPTLKESGTATTNGPQQKFRSLLVIGEVAVCFALLIAAGLMIRTFLATQHAALGFQTDKRLVFQIVLPEVLYPSQLDKARLAERVIERLQARPEFLQAGAFHPSMPLADFSSSSMYVAVGRTDEEGQNAGNLNVVGQALQALDVRLIRGRFFDASDLAAQRPVCVINQTMAARFFPDQDPVGRRIRFQGNPGDPGMEIVGVVGDVRRNAIHENPENQVFRPFEQVGWGGTFSMVVRTKGEPRTLAGAIRDEMRAVDPGVAVHEIRTVDEFVSANESYWTSRMNSWLFGCLGAAALVISLTGLYGVMAFSVGQRTKEFGLRLAIGATRAHILKLVLGHGLRLALFGLGIGLVLAVVLARLMQGLLFGVHALDLLTFGLISVLLAGVILLACWLPAQRAARVDPMRTLREE